MEFDERLTELIESAEALAEGLRDLAYGYLREGFFNKSEDSLKLEREVARARRSVEKAVHIMCSLQRMIEVSDE
jgi:hypothetical protein